jgi:hypothetical protein
VAIQAALYNAGQLHLSGSESPQIEMSPRLIEAITRDLVPADLARAATLNQG